MRVTGRSTRADVGMSNERRVRIPPPESPRVPGEGSSAQGKPGPKVNPKGVTDGKLVKNPVPCIYEIRGGTQKAKPREQVARSSKRKGRRKQ